MNRRKSTLVRRLVIDPAVTTAGLLRPRAGYRAPYERSVLDDIAMRRPWNLVVKAARVRARLRLGSLQPGVTVVVVNWNTKQLITDVIRAIRHFSPDETRILVCDNGSSDGSRETLRGMPGIEVLQLPANAGHGAALDLATCSARTNVVVTLDSDAIPLREGWLDPAVEPVRVGRAVLSGTRSSRGFVHPVFMAVSVREFVSRGLSFQIHILPGVTGDSGRWGVDAWDTAELMSGQVSHDELAFIGGDSAVNPNLPGGFVADLVYHHGAVTRESTGRVSEAALTGWRRACGELGLDFLRDGW